MPKKPGPPLPVPEPLTTKDLHQETLQALLTEYTCLREEAQHDDTHQIQLVTITFSTLVALVSAAAAFHDIIPLRVVRFLSFVALPCLTMFMGLLWIDLIFRRTRYGAYTKVLENKINHVLSAQEPSPGQTKQTAMGWEHWIQRLEKQNGFFSATRFFRGYIVSGSWLSAPLLIMGSYFLLSGQPFFKELGQVWDSSLRHLPVPLFMIVIAGIYYFFFVKFLIQIKRFPNEVN